MSDENLSAATLPQKKTGKQHHGGRVKYQTSVQSSKNPAHEEGEQKGETLGGDEFDLSSGKAKSLVKGHQRRKIGGRTGSTKNKP